MPAAGLTRDREERKFQRKLPIGAELVEGGAHFRVWAPRSKTVEVHLMNSDVGNSQSKVVELEVEPDGYFSAFVPEVRPGALYKFQLGSGEFPDPASRFQPEGPHGPSAIVDPRRFRWTDNAWRGVGRNGQVIYEMHIGTFTRKGTWRAAGEQLPHLADLGITVVEVMPAADFCGRFGWGYDGVNLFAPTRLYGTPDDFRAFVNCAHELGLGVILDVVYNHLGPAGNFLGEFSEHYFSTKHKTEWGEAINFDDTYCGPVREFFVANAGYWIDEFHLDGLRLDATQQIFDDSPNHILAAITRRVREAADGRATLIIGENETQETKLVRPEAQRGHGIDALWNDDFHHSAMVALTGRSEAYYSDHRGSPQEFISAAKYGYLFQGQWYSWQKKRRGTPALDLHPANFVNFLQNHDQVANSLHGARIHQLTSPGRLKALTALLLLGPGTPMLFQGQEFAAASPFLFFADHNPTLAILVAAGRKEFLRQFPSIACDESAARLCNPESEATFNACKLDFSERKKNAAHLRLHRDLIELRRRDPIFSNPRPHGVDGAVLSPEAFVLRFFGEGNDARMLLMNLGPDLQISIAPEPLLAPPENSSWTLLWSSEDPQYGGCGTPAVETENGWRIPGHAAVTFATTGSGAQKQYGSTN